MRTLLYRCCIAALIALPLAMATRYWFVCDDAFIAFRFVRNLVDGFGPVFNVGERVEGYTSFLWVVELAGLWSAFGWRPEDAAPWMGLAWTAATGVGVWALARRGPVPSERAVALLALLWWGTNRSVWVWSTSGLEERQFTALLTWALVCLARRDASRTAAVLGSVLVGLAALTRPEAYLIGPLMLAWAAGEGWARGDRAPARIAAVFAPAGLIVFAHVAWRYSYYGEILPNTYYAKNVRDWWEAGGAYLLYATLEHGLWAVLPLAVYGTQARRAKGDLVPLAMWLWAVPMYLHLAKIGGDHFEFRMLDLLWPPLYVAAAQGAVALAERLPRFALPAIATAVWAWGVAIPMAHDALAEARHGRAETEKMRVQPGLDDAPWLWTVPPIPLFIGLYNDVEAFAVGHSVAVRQREHLMFSRLVRGRFSGYQQVEQRDFFQPDAVAAESSVGAYGYYLPGMTLIDMKGLCDWTIARAPVKRDDAHRQLAHDRAPPKGYLESRGVNIEMEGVHVTLRGALRDGYFAVKLPDGRFGGYQARDPAYAERAFPGRETFDRTAMVDPWADGGADPAPVTERFEHDGVTWEVQRWLGRFDADVDGWTFEGKSFARQPALGRWLGQPKFQGHEGEGLLNSYHPSFDGWVKGVARSPSFVPSTGEALSLLLAGSGGAVVVRSDAGEVARLEAGHQTQLRRHLVPLDPWVGTTLWVELRDESASRSTGWLLFDAVSITTRATP